MKKKLFAAVAFLVVGVLSVFPPQFANAASFREQGVHHKEGVTCKDCHLVEKPKDTASYKPCLQCHGPYEKIAQRTKKVHGNPHDSHLGPMDCLKCHGVHEPIELENIPCIECHNDFEYKVK